jgi:hypothetical protein
VLRLAWTSGGATDFPGASAAVEAAAAMTASRPAMNAPLRTARQPPLLTAAFCWAALRVTELSNGG